jgi:uncharacterized protein (TIGR03382 family)
MKRTLAFVAVMAVAATASAFSVSRTGSNHLIKWYLNNPSVPILLDASGPQHLQAGYTYSDVQGAVQRSVASWNDIDCSKMTLVISGTTTSKQNVVSDTGADGGVPYDGRNVAVWISTASEYPFPQKVLGVTSPVFFQDGTIIEADVVFNDVADSWAVYASAADVGSATDVESVVVHEFGHLQGLGHVLNGASLPDPPTMTPTVDPHLGTRSLAQDDMNAVCFLYPQDGNSTHNCATDANCPAFIQSPQGDAGSEKIVGQSKCTSGHCDDILDVQCGSGNAGERCCTANCKSGLGCTAIDPHSDMAYCSATCDVSNPNCDSGFTCERLSTGNQGACITNVVLCDCDATQGTCDSGCSCDPDCSSGSNNNNNSSGGCNAAGASLWASSGLLGLLWLRRRAHQD